MVVMASGKVHRLQADEIPEQGRRTQGRAVVQGATGDRVVEVTRAYSERGGGRSEAEASAVAEEPGLAEGRQEPEAEDTVSAGQLDLLS